MKRRLAGVARQERHPGKIAAKAKSIGVNDWYVHANPCGAAAGYLAKNRCGQRFLLNRAATGGARRRKFNVCNLAC